MVILGLGSNKGDRLLNLQNAVSALRNVVKNITCSPIYESKALLPPDAPPEWNTMFLNMAVRCESDLMPRQLLTSVKTLEKNLGRTKAGYWGPREIDIDILAYDGMVINEEQLTIPHRFLIVRDFALIPLVDLEPEWIYPAEGQFKGMKARDLVPYLAPGLIRTGLVI